MTQTAERRLAVAERQLSELRIEVAKLNVLVGVLMQADRPADANVERVAQAAATLFEASPRRGGRRHLRLVDDASVDGQFLDEGLRRVRAARGEGR
ncbi:hypothetical protein [Streptomyces sp. S.PB5]|uniref:hypothetical protein n=1 Tax=Streptomyces sp. S.PB5 TaxID=3020844 RepID=UPI0025AFB7E6|nr:hypothetical protein [Streptomyces sp. S.PB5]MDN3023827.1 hypothetical protein [Streptomyces sp. S.PB5]